MGSKGPARFSLHFLKAICAVAVSAALLAGCGGASTAERANTACIEHKGVRAVEGVGLRFVTAVCRDGTAVELDID